MLKFNKVTIFIALALLFTACEEAAGDDGNLKVVATTNIVGDVVSVVGGDLIDLTVLLPVGVDPHSFQPTPRDLAAVSDAEVIFINGLGLEEFLAEMLANAASEAEVVAVSAGVDIDLLEGDPHVWLDPANVALWAEAVAAALNGQDPANTAAYTANAVAYVEEVLALDAWIEEQVAQIPPARRQLVTDHDSLAYFAARYGFTVVGAVMPGYSTLAEPSAQDLAALEDAIRALDVSTVFVGSSINPGLAGRVAEDTGTQLFPLYTGSLSGPDGPAPTYIAMMRHDVNVIVAGLR